MTVDSTEVAALVQFVFALVDRAADDGLHGQKNPPGVHVGASQIQVEVNGEKP